MEGVCVCRWTWLNGVNERAGVDERGEIREEEVSRTVVSDPRPKWRRREIEKKRLEFRTESKRENEKGMDSTQFFEEWTVNHTLYMHRSILSFSLSFIRIRSDSSLFSLSLSRLWRHKREIIPFSNVLPTTFDFLSRNSSSFRVGLQVPENRCLIKSQKAFSRLFSLLVSNQFQLIDHWIRTIVLEDLVGTHALTHISQVTRRWHAQVEQLSELWCVQSFSESAYSLRGQEWNGLRQTRETLVDCELCYLKKRNHVDCQDRMPSPSNECRRFDGVAVITSALHAECREFKPRSNLLFFLLFLLVERRRRGILFGFPSLSG